MTPMGEAEFTHLDGQETLSRLQEIQQVYAEAFPSYDLADHQWRTSRQAQTSSFSAVIAHMSERIVGFVYGLPLTAATGWWDGMEPPPENGFTNETGNRTFAVIDLAVLPDQRGHGLGRRLLDELLRSRREERATLAADPQDKGAQAMYERWGWRKVGRVPGGEHSTEAVFDLYMIALRDEGAATSSR